MMRKGIFIPKEIAKTGYSEFELSYEIYFNDGSIVASKLKVHNEVTHWREMFEIIQSYYNAELTLH